MDQALNRKDRRRAEKMARRHPQKSRRSFSDLYFSVESTLNRGKDDPIPQEQIDLTIGQCLAQLERLRTGSLDDDGFVMLMRGAAFCFTLAARLYDYGTGSTKALVMQTQPISELAADRLAVLGARFEAKGKFIADAETLSALRDCYGVLEQLMGVSSEGHGWAALNEAKRLTLNPESPNIMRAIKVGAGLTI